MAKVLNLVPGWDKRYPTRNGGFAVVTKHNPTGGGVFCYHANYYAADGTFLETESCGVYGTIDGEDPDDTDDHDPDPRDILSDVPLAPNEDKQPEPTKTDEPFMVEGGWYLTRSGKLVGPLTFDPDNDTFSWDAPGLSFTNEGKEYPNEERDNDLMVRADKRIETLLNAYLQQLQVSSPAETNNLVPAMLDAAAGVDRPPVPVPPPKKVENEGWIFGRGQQVGDRKQFLYVDITAKEKERILAIGTKGPGDVFHAGYAYYPIADRIPLPTVATKPSYCYYRVLETNAVFHGFQYIETDTNEQLVLDVLTSTIHPLDTVEQLTR